MVEVISIESLSKLDPGWTILTNNNPRVTAIAIHFLDGIERSKDFSYNQLLDIKHLLYTWIDVLGRPDAATDLLQEIKEEE